MRICSTLVSLFASTACVLAAWWPTSGRADIHCPKPGQPGCTAVRIVSRVDADGDGKVARAEGAMLPNGVSIDLDQDGILTPQSVAAIDTPKESKKEPCILSHSLF
jgi:hypothetical protein